jgi:hypothetical protein
MAEMEGREIIIVTTRRREREKKQTIETGVMLKQPHTQTCTSVTRKIHVLCVHV